ncbi:phage tail protein [Gemmobacter lutimaris]|uniref:Phage tail protein n=1 Tax=Gemmobacter lutimaris TaxID=2306023 RepID=A0A398BQS2_9RHOB|nr:phage tail protein [Gemmobacter lutimaris]RID89673.1 phage tail protein [Gemmobacter lutimaris]
MTAARIPVTAARAIDPGFGRADLQVPPGLTLEAIVALALPGLAPEERGALRVMLVSPKGSAVIDPRFWHVVRPRDGVHVVIRLVPGDDALRSILSIVVSVAAVAFGGPLAGMLGITSQLGVSLVTAGLTVVGQLLVNALIPPPKPLERENRYAIGGWRNQVVPDGAVPVVLGRHRYAPPFAAMSWTEIVGDWQYIRSLFCFGYGPLALSEFRIGETALEEFDEVETEVRTGLPGDAPCSLYPRQIVEENVGAELLRPLPRDDLGEVIEGEPAEEAPVIRTTGADASAASVILAFPGGLVAHSKKGDAKAHSVRIRIRQRLVTAEVWEDVVTLEISAKKLETFYRQHTWDLPSRGRWQVEVTMLTDETTDNKIQQRCSWAALQTIRPEYPLNFDKPLALVAVRIKATHQLNGTLDNFSALVERPCLDWDHVAEAWVERVTTNPVALYRHVLQSPANPRPVADAGLDLQQLQDWHDFCRVNGLTYSRPLDATGTTLRDVLAEVAAAGRATPRHDGLRWGVTVDWPSALIVDHITPRNSRGFRTRRNYVDPPHAFRVKFADAGNDFREAERLVRWPGHTGEIELTELLDLPGKTDAAEVWREARRRQYEAISRPDTFEVTQDGPVRVATRGDHVMLSSDVIDQVQRAARVRRVTGQRIELDELVTMEAGLDYGLRFRVFEGDEDTVGASVVRTVSTVPGETQILTLEGGGDLPGVGDLVMFGRATTEALHLIVTGVEAGTGFTSILRMVEAAPIIDTLLAADTIPAWSSRVGAELDESLLAPAVPRFTRIASGASGSTDANRVDYLIAPGSSAITTAGYAIDHRLSGAGGWTTVTIPAANGGGALEVYAAGDAIEMQARAVSISGVESASTAIVSLTIGAGDADIPAALDDEAVSVTTLPGGALIQLATGADPATAAVQVYRSDTATLDRATDAVGAPQAVAPLASFTFAVGDTTRTNLVAGGGMDSPADWTLAGGWTIAAGLASHAAGAADALWQAVDLRAGRWYRLSCRVQGRTAGILTPYFTVGTNVAGASISANGTHLDRIQAVTGNERLLFQAASTFDGALDDVVLYAETSACLARGTHYLWLEPQNADGVPGPVSGPFIITVT